MSGGEADLDPPQEPDVSFLRDWKGSVKHYLSFMGSIVIFRIDEVRYYVHASACLLFAEIGIEFALARWARGKQEESGSSV